MVKTRVFYALSTVDIMLCTTLIAFLDKQLFFLASGFHRMQGSLCCQITSRVIQPGQVLPTGLYLTSKLSVLTGLGILLIHLFWFWCFCRRWWNAGRRTISHKSSGPCPANGLSLSIWIRVNLMWWELHCLPNSWQREVVELNVPVFKVHWSNYAVQCLMRSPKNLTMCGWQGFPQQLMKNSDDIMIQD